MTWNLIYDQQLTATPVDWRSYTPIPRQSVPGSFTFNSLTVRATSSGAPVHWWLGCDFFVIEEDVLHPQSPIVHQVVKIPLNHTYLILPNTAIYQLFFDIPTYMQNAHIKIWGKE